MPQRQEPFVNSAHHYSRHEYLDRDRSLPLSHPELTYASSGHLLETYVDALHVMLLMDEPSFLIRVRDTPELIRNPTFIRAAHRLPPSYVIEALGNYLESPSFFVKHLIGRPNEPTRQDTEQPSATQFAQEVHAQLRQLGIQYSKKITLSLFPPSGSGHLLDADQWTSLKKGEPQWAVQGFRDAIDSYKELFQNFSKEWRQTNCPPVAGKSPQAQAYMSAEQKKALFDAFEASPELETFNTHLTRTLATLTKALTPPVLTSVFVTIGEETWAVENQQLSTKFPNSYPALVHLALGYVGRHQVDRTFFPKEGFHYLLTVLGVESSVSDTVERLNQHITRALTAAGSSPADDLLFPSESRDTLLRSIGTHARGIQLLYLFHRTAGILEKIYPPGKDETSYQDMEQLLSFSRSGVELESLERPEEVATLLYAIERRMRALSELDSDLYNRIGIMLNKAGHLGRKNHFSEVSQKLRYDILSSLDHLENAELITFPVKRQILQAILLIRKALTPDAAHAQAEPSPEDKS